MSKATKDLGPSSATTGYAKWLLEEAKPNRKPVNKDNSRKVYKKGAEKHNCVLYTRQRPSILCPVSGKHICSGYKVAQTVDTKTRGANMMSNWAFLTVRSSIL